MSRWIRVPKWNCKLSEGFKPLVKSSLFLGETVELAKLCNQSRIIIEQPRDGVGTGSTRRVQLGGFDKAGFEIESAAHNRRYIKSASEPGQSSEADST